MKITTPNFRRLLFLFLLFINLTAQCFSQETKPLNQTEIPTLVSKLKDKDPRVAVTAADKLISYGSEAVPSIVAFLDSEKKCFPLVMAVGVMNRLDPKNQIIPSALTKVMQNKCYDDRQKDIVIRRRAAIALGTTPAGIQILAETLKDKDTFDRQSAAFAFDELSERIEGQRPDSIIPTTSIIEATKAAIPALVGATKDKDEIVRCMSYESLEQLQRSQHKELRDEANRLMQGVRVKCSR